MALQLQHLEWFPRFVSIQLQMDPELLGFQVPGNYQACDHQVQGFDHHNLAQINELKNNKIPVLNNDFNNFKYFTVQRIEVCRNYTNQSRRYMGYSSGSPE